MAILHNDAAHSLVFGKVVDAGTGGQFFLTHEALNDFNISFSADRKRVPAATSPWSELPRQTLGQRVRFCTDLGCQCGARASGNCPAITGSRFREPTPEFLHTAFECFLAGSRIVAPGKQGCPTKAEYSREYYLFKLETNWNWAAAF